MLRVAIGQLKVSSHQFEIEAVKATLITRAAKICTPCQEEVESKKHCVCRCKAYCDIRERDTTIFNGDPTLRQIMKSAD